MKISTSKRASVIGSIQVGHGRRVQRLFTAAVAGLGEAGGQRQRLRLQLKKAGTTIFTRQWS
jgi:hypothetical protein